MYNKRSCTDAKPCHRRHGPAGLEEAQPSRPGSRMARVPEMPCCSPHRRPQTPGPQGSGCGPAAAPPHPAQKIPRQLPAENPWRYHRA